MEAFDCIENLCFDISEIERFSHSNMCFFLVSKKSFPCIDIMPLSLISLHGVHADIPV